MIKFITAVIFLLAGALSADTSIGKVIVVEGSVKAGSRGLSRGASIYVSDVINVPDGGKIQIRFTDGSILNLIESTQYRIDSYQLSSSGTGQYSAQLVEGGFRAVSGSIGKNSPDNYSVKTPVATLGVRGTLFEANIQSGETFFGCESGTIRVKNKAGERVLGAGQFVSARSQRMLGEVTNVRPAALANALFTPPEGGISQEDVEEGTETGEEEEEAAGENEEEGEEVEEVELSEDEGNPPC
jgi:hypothetical protein